MVKRATVCVISIIVWIALLISHHIVCFDVLESGSWYLYLVAILLAALQYGLLVCANATIFYRKFLLIPFVMYMVCFLSKAAQLMFLWHHGQKSVGLTLVCILIDAIGGIFAFSLFKRKSTDKLK